MGHTLFPRVLMWPADRLFTDHGQTHQDEEGARAGSKIERPVNVVVVIDQSEQIGPQGLAHSHDHPVYREESCSVLRFGISASIFRMLAMLIPCANPNRPIGSSSPQMPEMEGTIKKLMK